MSVDRAGAEKIVGEEWAEWYALTPQERFLDSSKLWETYLAQVRHQTTQKPRKPFRISSGYRRVSTTFRMRIQPFRNAEAELMK